MSINSEKEPNIRGEVVQLRRIADTMEEILRLVKVDQAKTAERMREYDNEDDMLDDLSKPWKEDKPSHTHEEIVELTK